MDNFRRKRRRRQRIRRRTRLKTSRTIRRRIRPQKNNFDSLYLNKYWRAFSISII